MKRILKKDYMELVQNCKNLINKNLEVLSVERDELGTTYNCDSVAGGKLKIKLENFSFVDRVYSVFIQFEDKDKLLELVGDSYYKANVFHENKINIMGFSEQKDYVYSRFYELISCVIDFDSDVLE